MVTIAFAACAEAMAHCEATITAQRNRVDKLLAAMQEITDAKYGTIVWVMEPVGADSPSRVAAAACADDIRHSKASALFAHICPPVLRSCVRVSAIVDGSWETNSKRFTETITDIQTRTHALVIPPFLPALRRDSCWLLAHV